jgi:tRNA A-37 threonylcarbamoyl transferase component Bud32
MKEPQSVELFSLPGGFHGGSRYRLDADQRRQLAAILEARPGKSMQVLNGRGNVLHTEIDGIGKVVVKRYMRGGLLRYVVRRKYLRHGPTRSESEFSLLERVRALGVHAPEPVAFVHRGWPFYDAWLLTREVENRANFADLARRNEDEIFKYSDEIVRQISILIKNGVFHVDLHPGNVIVDDREKLYLLDFDKARMFRGPLNKLRDHYLVRWRRAVIKHHLPEAVSERICPGLRRNYET